MAIRKDLDDMLNNLKKGGETGRSARNEQSVPKRKSIYDDMSVDDLLNALTEEKKPSLAENIISELEEKNNKTEDILPEKEALPEESTPVSQPETKKKKIVITGELPDYEAIRRQEMERMRLEHDLAGFSVQSDEPEEADGDIREEAVTEGDMKAAEIPPETSFEETESISDETPYESEPELDPVPLPEEEPKSGKKLKKGLFSRHKKKRDEKESTEETETETVEETASDDEYAVKNGDVSVDDFSEEITADEPAEETFAEVSAEEETSSAVELIDAALAAINEVSDVSQPEISEVSNKGENISEIDESEPSESRVSTLIDGIREDAANAIAELEKTKEETEEIPDEPDTEKEPAKETDNSAEKKRGRITSALTRILDEDTDALLNEKSEKTESDENTEKKSGGKFRKRLYAVLGVVFAIFAVIGIVVSVGKGIGLIKSFTSGEVKKDGFTEVIYPAVIMDIESFNSPSELTSEQIITASIWSIIMNEDKISKYSLNAGGDTVSISSYDVEAQAVELFGEELPEFVHTTLGPVESRFYFDSDRGAYNVKVKPIIFTYHPEIKSIVKSGSDYTVTVDYVDERPEWMDKSVSKSVEFKITEKDDGTYRINSMKILYMKTSN